MRKLIVVLLAAVLILVFGMIAAMLTSCGISPRPENVVPLRTVQTTVIISDGSEWHPWRLQDGIQPVQWVVTTDNTWGGYPWLIQTWTISNVQVVPSIRIGSFVLYDSGVYQVWNIDVVHHTMKSIRQ